MDLQIHKDKFEGCNCSSYFISLFFFLIWPVIDHIHLSMCFCNTWPQDVRSVDSKVDSFLMVSWQLIHNSSSALVSQCMEASKLLDSAFLISWEFKGIPPNATP